MPSDERNRTIDGAGGSGHRGIRNAQQRTKYERRQRLAGTKQSVRRAVKTSVSCLLRPKILRGPRKRAALTFPRARGDARRRHQEDAAVNAHDRP
jgi:hypothetical protein